MFDEESDFRIHCDLEAFEKAGDEQPMRIGGLVSTDDRDQDKEKIIQHGLDFSHFLSKGWFNDNHSKKTTGILGYPTDAKYMRKGADLPNGRKAKSNGWWAEGYLINNDEGRKVYSLIKGLQPTGRKLGFSIEGKIKKRDDLDPTVVSKADVHHVAITHCPVNTATELDMLAKALTAGHAILSTDINAGAGSGGALRTEHLDEGVSNLLDLDEDDDTSEEVEKAFSFEPISEADYIDSWAHALAHVDLDPGVLTADEARIIVKSEHPEYTDRQIDSILDLATGA